MEAKDTVKDKIRQAKLQLGDDFGDEGMMEEAIFKAGWDARKFREIEEVHKIASQCLVEAKQELEEEKKRIAEAKKAGIREVVEWVKRNDFYNGTDPAGICIENPLWQAQLKEWFSENIEDLKDLW